MHKQILNHPRFWKTLYWFHANIEIINKSLLIGLTYH